MTTRYFSRVESSDSFSVNTWWRWFPAYYSALNRGAEYCDERVCVCVCVSVRDHIFGTARTIFTKFFYACYL